MSELTTQQFVIIMYIFMYLSLIFDFDKLFDKFNSDKIDKTIKFYNSLNDVDVD